MAHDWPAFLDDFQRHWPTDEDHTYVDSVRDGVRGNGAARSGNPRWRRMTEERAGAKAEYLAPSLTDEDRKQAEIEGWILGIK